MSIQTKLAVFLLLFALLLPGCASGGRDTGAAAFSLRIQDGLTGSPLPDAAVVIPETDTIYRPDADGMTQIISVVPEEDSRWAKRLPQPFGEITLLVYCPGYYPLALFHFLVKPGTDRGCIPLYLFPEDGSLKAPYVLAEGPDTGWVRELLRTYQPAD